MVEQCGGTVIVEQWNSGTVEQWNSVGRRVWWKSVVEQ